MRQSLVGVIATMLGSAMFSSALLGSALAADMAPAYKVPPPPPPMFSWTGIYIGIHGGGAWAFKEWTTTNTGINGRFLDQHTATGVLGGGQIGFNFQTGPVVLGAEAQFSWSDLDGTSGCGFSTGLDCHTKADWLSTAAGRLGLAFDRTLVFVKAGGAWIHDKYDITGTFRPFPVVRATQSRSGWMFGTGVEHAFYGNWSAKVEYDYLDFGNKIVNFTGLTALTGYDEPVDIRQRVHLVKFGLNYRFGYDGPVAARY
jgi:outer membrane immunogenic protein